MAWSTYFVAMLGNRRHAPVFVLERVAMGGSPGGPFQVCSHDGYGLPKHIGLRGVHVQGQVLDSSSWSSTAGGFSVDYVGDPSLLRSAVTKGTFLALKVGYPGMDLGDFETVAVGAVRNVRGQPPRLSIECLDLYTSLRQRLDTTAASVRLFGNTGGTTTLSADYAPTDTTLNVVDATPLDEFETGGYGLLKIEPTSGDPFYLRYTATGVATATTVNGNQCGTTMSNSVTGDTVTGLAYLMGHPIDIARKVLQSTGAGTNGTYDTLPEKWGLKVGSSYIDHDDCDAWRAVIQPATGTYDWEVIVDSPQDNALDWLNGQLAAAGFFLAVRQGLLTVHAAQYSLNAGAKASGIEITDADIESVESEWFNSDHDTEYGKVVALTYASGTSSSTEALATFPGSWFLQYDVSDREFGNRNAIEQEMVNRLFEAAERIPERLVLQCASMRMAQLSVGELATLTTSRWYTRQGGSAGLNARRVLVTEVSPDWVAGRVRLALELFPASSDTFPADT